MERANRRSVANLSTPDAAFFTLSMMKLDLGSDVGSILLRLSLVFLCDPCLLLVINMHSSATR